MKISEFLSLPVASRIYILNFLIIPMLDILGHKNKKIKQKYFIFLIKYSLLLI